MKKCPLCKRPMPTYKCANIDCILARVPVIKGGVNIITPYEPETPKIKSKKWGTKYP